MINNYQNIIVSEQDGYITITLNRPKDNNSLNEAMLNELSYAIDRAELQQKYKVIVIKGHDNHFCTGVDLRETFINRDKSQTDMSSLLAKSELYKNLMQKLATINKIIICAVEGKALGGGIGILAASDLVIAGPKSTFGLPETMWGLLPSIVLPYLIRRVGYQVAYRLTITCGILSAQDAKKINLVDITSDDLERSLSILLKRCLRLQNQTIYDIKKYFNKLSPISTQQLNDAVVETSRLLSNPRVIKNITNYILYQKLPWEIENE